MIGFIVHLEIFIHTKASETGICNLQLIKLAFKKND